MKTIVITGASSGIGKATTKYFASKEWQVIATMRNVEKEKELNLLENVDLITLDVTDSKSIDLAYQSIQDKYHKIDVLLNNAGYCLFGPLELSSEKQIIDTYNILTCWFNSL